ncbi:zinc transporter ZntB [Arsenophonus apicola]|nr:MULTISPECIES: zinc transporter ZntB [Arsenophonus]UBX30544.1 zinc transporter ZntB [Arsenophonus apicola]
MGVVAIYGSIIQGSEPVHAYQLDGEGGFITIDVNAEATPQMPFWLHYDYRNKASYQWIKHSALFNSTIKDGLTGNINRLRIIRTGDGTLINLQTINKNIGDRPEQLVAFRIYINNQIIVSSRHRKVKSLEPVIDDLTHHVGAKTSGEWLVEVADSINDEVSDFTDILHDRLIKMEEKILTEEIPERGKLALLRKQIIIVRRYMSTQRDVFARLATEKFQWMSDDDRHRMQENAERLGRCIDELDGFVARTAVITDEINALISEATNKRIYTMSMLAIVFLPSTFLTGLFGVNLNGIPGSEFKFAFSIFCLLLSCLITFVIWWLKRGKWL